MTDARKAKLFYLTEPSRGVFVVNVQVEHTLGRIEISRDQLANFLVDGAGMALRDYGQPTAHESAVSHETIDSNGGAT